LKFFKIFTTSFRDLAGIDGSKAENSSSFVSVFTLVRNNIPWKRRIELSLNLTSEQKAILVCNKLSH